MKTVTMPVQTKEHILTLAAAGNHSNIPLTQH